jgi:hypothetical protein
MKKIRALDLEKFLNLFKNKLYPEFIKNLSPESKKRIRNFTLKLKGEFLKIKNSGNSPIIVNR